MDKKDTEMAGRAKDAFERAGIKNKDLAQRIGKSGATVSDYLRGNIRIPTNVVAEIAAMTGASLRWLITGQEILRDGRAEQGVAGGVNEDSPEYITQPLKLTRQEEEVVYWLRGMSPELRDIAAEGVRSVWIMANRRSETKKHSE
jgi:transcriptional regulator with XRE-family HTH domain